MYKNFSLFRDLYFHRETIEKIFDCLKIPLGPIGKNGITYEKKNEIKFLTNGSLFIKSLDFNNYSANIILKLFEQASLKTLNISNDGSTITILLACQILLNSFSFLVNGYNSLLIANGFKKIGYFFMEKIMEYSHPILSKKELIGLFQTSIGKKMNRELENIIEQSISYIEKDGLILVEENNSPFNEIDLVQGVELDRGFASSYFVNDLKNFEIRYDNPYVLITSLSIYDLNQIRDILDYVKLNTRPLVIIGDNIKKEIISTLVLNNIQKKIKVVVVNYKSIQFLKNGVLEDLALLTHSNYFIPSSKNEIKKLTISDLGYADKVIIRKEKSTFLISKVGKLIVKRRINELGRELITSETEHEKNIIQTRIARLAGNITKIKLGISNKYEIEEQRQKVEKSIKTLRSGLEEGFLPGGGVFYLQLREELKNWSLFNLIGEEVFASQIILDALLVPCNELLNNLGSEKYSIYTSLSQFGYPYAYDILTKKIVNSLQVYLIDSAKSVRSGLWNALTTVSMLIISI